MVCEVTETFDLRVQVDICDNSKEFPAAHSGYMVNGTDRIKTVKRRLSLLKLSCVIGPHPGGHEQQLGLHVRCETTGQKLPGGPGCQELENTWNTPQTSWN